MARKQIEPPKGLELVEIPKRHRAYDWPPSERAALAARLASLGSSIRELSDAREALGLSRLSWSLPLARAVSPALLLGRKGQATLRSVRQERAELALDLARCSDEAVRWSRQRVGLKADVEQWRLGDLRAVTLQAQRFDAARRSELAQPQRPAPQGDQRGGENNTEPCVSPVP